VNKYFDKGVFGTKKSKLILMTFTHPGVRKIFKTLTANSQKPKAKSQKPKAKSQKPKAKSQKSKVKS
jgi:hypothetical protein